MIVLAVLLIAGAVYLLYLSSGGNVNTSASPLVQSLAKAIAFAEGFYVSGSRPQRDHNPGDMTEDLIGKSVGTDGSFVVFASDDDGWNNLYAQINKWLDGTSAHATSDSTIADISQFYTDTQQSDWANNVASYLGVSTDTPIGSVPTS